MKKVILALAFSTFLGSQILALSDQNFVRRYSANSHIYNSAVYYSHRAIDKAKGVRLHDRKAPTKPKPQKKVRLHSRKNSKKSLSRA